MPKLRNSHIAIAILQIIFVVIFLVAYKTQPSSLTPQSQSQLDIITGREQKEIVCGIDGNLPGMSQTANGQELPPFDGYGAEVDYGDFKGFDADFCRVLAVAIFGDSSKVRFIPVDINPNAENERFDAVLGGKIDVLIRNTTWTAARDVLTKQNTGDKTPDFGPVIYYDAQRIYVSRPDGGGVPGPEALVGLKVCVIGNTTNEANLADVAADLNLGSIVSVSDASFVEKFTEGECDAISADETIVVGDLGGLIDNGSLVPVELGFELSREPLAPVILGNDSKWRDAVSYAIYVTIYADALGINQDNLEQKRTQASIENDPALQDFFRNSNNLATQLGLQVNFAPEIIKQVGSYSDIYRRNHGNRPRYKYNYAWTEGGLLFAPPFGR